MTEAICNYAKSCDVNAAYTARGIQFLQGVLNGYNGTVMAYGQTGSGKTYTLGRLGKDDASKRGIMIRSLEDIIANISHASDSVDVSYLQVMKMSDVSMIVLSYISCF